jgi:hypothetical protein
MSTPPNQLEGRSRRRDPTTTRLAVITTIEQNACDASDA